MSERLRCVKTDLVRALTGYGPYCGLLAGVCLLALAPGLHQPPEPTVTYYVMVAMNVSVAPFALPVAGALPFSGALMEDIQSGYAVLILRRVSARAYLAARYFVCVLTGGLAQGGALAVFLAALSAFLPFSNDSHIQGVVPACLETLVRAGRYGPYLLTFFSLHTLSGAFCAATGMVASVLFRRRSYAYPGAVLAVYAISRFFGLFGVDYPLLLQGALHAQGTWQAAWLSASGIFLLLIVILYGVLRALTRKEGWACADRP